MRKLAGIDTIYLTEAEVSAMQVDLGPAQTICPRQPVQVRATVVARLPGQAAPAQYRTWSGGTGTRRNGMLDFRNFAFASEQGRFDERGWFLPDPDVLATVERGFAIRAQLLHPRTPFAQTLHWDADYDCIVSVGAPGGPGAGGADGQAGYDGREGRDDVRGHRGGDGAQGGDGAPGEPGFHGPQLRMYATYVASARHPRLIAVQVEGDVQDFVLAPPERVLTLLAAGGAGGPGGAGGRGGNGGNGGNGRGDAERPGRGGEGGDGGDGGAGGPGGHGGDGGRIELVFDRRFPELQQWLRLEVGGGAPGRGGSAGFAGEEGAGGSGSGGGGGSGRDGRYGVSGPDGLPGRPGWAQARPGEVAEHFRDLPGLRLL